LPFVAELEDSLGRVPKKLRISVTDRCNFRCTFCMPRNPLWLPRQEILSYEEIGRVVTVLARLGIEKIRLSGGEPLVRKDLERLIRILTAVRGIRSVAMTTNGYFLREKTRVLKQAGLGGITVSLHSLKRERFEEVTGAGAFERVLDGIHAAKEAGFNPLKINAVIIRDCNDDEIVDLASLALEGDVTVRFIEYMPFDGERMWGMEKVVSGKEILARIRVAPEIVPIEREAGSTARIYKFKDGPGRIGIITSITEPFCSDCDRIRLSADGKIVPCLFDKTGYDLKPLLRGGASEAIIANFIRVGVQRKAPGVQSMLTKLEPLAHIRPMYTIGG